MKKLLFFTLLIVSINTFSQSTPLSSSNAEPGPDLKVLLGITHNDDVVSSSLRTTINTMQGAKVLSYCNNHALFMVIVDNNIYTDSNDFLNKLQKQAPQSALLLSVKQGDFDGFVKFCEPADATDAKRLKASLNN